MHCNICIYWTREKGCAHYDPPKGRTVPVLQLHQVDNAYHSGIKEDRYIHNVDGLRQINYEPGPSRADVERIIAGARSMTEHNGRPTKMILTRDGYLYYSQDTPGYCDGEITVTENQLRAATPTTTVIY